jgi:PAS domain-containing protein
MVPKTLAGATLRAAVTCRPGGFSRWIETLMSSSSKHRSGRRTGSTSSRFKPSELVPVDTSRRPTFTLANKIGSIAVGLVALALIVLIWIVTGPVIAEQGAEIRERAEKSLTAQAATLAETISHELRMIDQSLTIIQAAWKQDSDSVDLIKWQQKMPALTEVADDLFIADENSIIRQDIIPQAVGQGVGAAYVRFPHGVLETFQSNGSNETDSLLIQGAGGPPVDARQFLMYLVRALDHPKGWLVGASYHSTELTKLFAQAALGFNPVVALVETQHGNIQAIVGPTARRPKTDLSKTPLYAAMLRDNSGTWLGPTGVDDVERLHAFHRVPHRDMIVVVAANWDEVMEPANDLAAATRILAAIGTALVVGIAALVIWEFYSIGRRRRREKIFERNRTEVERLRAEEAVFTARAQLNAARLNSVVANASDGFALFDSGQRLLQWNFAFTRGLGIDPRQDMPLDTLLREHLASAGAASGETDSAAEVARRGSLLRAGDPAGLPIRGPDGDALILRGLPIEPGGFVLLLNGFTSWQPAPAPNPQKSPGDGINPVPLSPAPVEW